MFKFLKSNWISKFEFGGIQLLIISMETKWVPRGVFVDLWPCILSVSGSIPGNCKLKKLFIWMKIQFLLAIHGKDILSQSTKTNRDIEFVSKLYNILTIGEWQSLRIIQLGPATAQEWVTSVQKKRMETFLLVLTVNVQVFYIWAPPWLEFFFSREIDSFWCSNLLSVKM